MRSLETPQAYWSGPVVATNIIVFMNLLGALLLGLLAGDERSHHGRWKKMGPLPQLPNRHTETNTDA